MNEDLQLEMAKDAPYYQYIGMEIVELSHGFAKLVMDFKGDLTHTFGYFHGGVIASLADSAGFNAVMTSLNDNEQAVTLEMKINFLLPAKDTGLYAEGRMVHRGKKTAVSDVEVKNDDGRLVAKAIVTCAIF